MDDENAPKRTRTLKVRVSPEDKAAIAEKAKAAGLSVSALMRRSAKDGKVVQATRIPDEQWIELGGALTALRSVAKSLEHRRGEGQVDLLVDLVADTCVHVEGIRGLLLQ